MSDVEVIPRYPLFINGETCEPLSGEYAPVINPANGQLVAHVAMGNSDDVDFAVASAQAAFDDPAWRKMAPEERSKLLYKLANLILANAQELAMLEISSSGGTISRIMGLDIPAIADLFMVLAEEVKTYAFVENLPARPLPEPCHTQVWKEPVGVCGLITAWNFPLLLFAMKVAPALAMGNTVVVKPAETTPTSTLRLAEIFAAALPKGVLNVVVGEGPVVGEAMSLHPHIDKISFTGSSNIGRKVQENAALTMKRVSLELGGKGPAIVMPDADIDLLAYGALFGVFLNAGQACESGTRLLVPDSIYDAVLDKLVEVAGNVVVGDPMREGTSYGPMASETHFKSVLDYIASAEAEGARVACGGRQAKVDGFAGGFFIEPTILADVTNTMTVACEEIFGPVLSVIRYTDLDDAIRQANDNAYGLSAGIWTDDLVQAQHIAHRLKAGSVWINDWHMMRTDAPFGGCKQSGYGREFGRYSFEAYVETKTVSTAFQRDPSKKALFRMVHSKFV